MLPLDDPRWKEMNHRGWVNGKPYDLDPGAPFVPIELRKLLQDPSDFATFNSLWPYLCSEGTAWAAAYAAVPYAVELARRLAPGERIEHLFFVGLVVMYSCPERGVSFEIKPYLAESYRQALTEALPLVAESLVQQHDRTDTRYLLAAAAALKGHPKLGGILEHLDCICGVCPKCGEHVYPEEVQQAIGKESADTT